MRLICLYLKEFYREQFRWRFFLPLAAFMALTFALNYRLEFKDTWIGYGGQDPLKYLRIFLFYLLPLCVSLTLYTRLGPRGNTGDLRQPVGLRAWAFLLFAALAYTMAVGWTPYENLIHSEIPRAGRAWASTTAAFAVRSVLMLALPLAWWTFRDRGKVENVYGFRWTSGHSSTYLLLAALAVLLALLASFTPGFSTFYPMARPDNSAADALGLSPILLFLIWEGVYLLQFVALEFFFRGFLVLGLGRLMGDGAVWIMASMYMFIHFSKPPLEALASFFAGVLLGVIALRTRSILGGVILHGTIALAMDLFALLRMP